MKSLTITLCVAFFAATAGFAQENGVLTAVGEAQVEAAPDMAQVSLGVRSRHAVAATALAETSKAVAAVIARLRDSGIAPHDIQTGSISLHPIYAPRREANAEQPPITGFEASNQVDVRVRDLDGLGGLLDMVVSDGANTLSGLEFMLSDPEPVEAAARQAAVRDAMDRADQLAQAAEVGRGAILTISEALQGGAMPMMEMASARRASVPVAPGMLTVRARVTMTFEIAQ